MTQKTIQSFMNGTYSNGPKQNYAINKTDVYYIDNIWSLDIKHLKDYGPEISRRHRYVLMVIDTFTKFVWTTPLKMKLLKQ